MFPAKELIEELSFRGSPAEAVAVMRRVIKKINHEGKGMGPDRHVAYDDTAERDANWSSSPWITARFGLRTGPTPYNCMIEAVGLPDGKTRLEVWVWKEGWDKASWVWQRIVDEMRRDGRIDLAGDESVKKARFRDSGRPQYPENAWAYQQVNELGRDPMDVYPEWCKRAANRVKELADPMESFKKAIKPK